ncbi:hypothetical protein DQ04_00331180 [Trypanosoma grayi]|uniref:hypothetical protein n=1 Tax=Trypanosoma grayi TaxID=71804 RepID=UPI0004F41F36|nr:hypothetical protein DQ04_00331180 [Trypanosoma grayi]KEG14725.1 hypothetical protein DQ04_00331180 [Trypanosoma grayi]
MPSLLSLQHRADAVLHQQLRMVEEHQKQHQREQQQRFGRRGNGMATPGQSPIQQGHGCQSPLAEISVDTVPLNGHGAMDADDDIQSLIRDAFSLAASHNPLKREAVLSSYLSDTDNIYLCAMNTAYRLYGEHNGWVEEEEDEEYPVGPSRCVSVPNEVDRDFAFGSSPISDQSVAATTHHDLEGLLLGTPSRTLPRRSAGVEEALANQALQTTSGLSPSARRLFDAHESAARKRGIDRGRWAGNRSP